MKFDDLPAETIEEILLLCDPVEVASLSQCSRFFAVLIRNPPDSHLWRELYLLQGLDDPRRCYTPHGLPLFNNDEEIDWKGLLEPVIRARTVLEKGLVLHNPKDRIEILKTLIRLISNTPPKESFSSKSNSHNILWVMNILQRWTFFDSSRITWVPEEEELQLRGKLHTYYGLMEGDMLPEARVASRAFVYSWRNHTWETDFGPLLPGSGGLGVNWEHMQAINHVMGSYVSDMGSGEGGLPMTLDETQMVLPEKEADKRDWAGVSGTWSCWFCFCDHLELRKYNESAPPGQPLDTSVFASADFREVFRKLSVTIRITGTQPDLDHPSHPVIFFGGYLAQPQTLASYTMTGKVSMTPDNQVRWHFVSGEQGNPIWSSEGVQVGGLRSAYGILGSWTTVFHDADDPVGPFWLRRASDEASE